MTTTRTTSTTVRASSLALLRILVALAVFAAVLGEDRSSHVGTASSVRRKLLNPRATIPQIMWFFAPHDILVMKQPADVYENVKNTVSVYRKAWASPGAPANFVDATLMCISALKFVEPDLEPIVKTETDPKVKENICMAAILYKNGGYWVTKEAKVSQAYLPSESTTLASTLECEDDACALPAFVASKRNHPLLKQMLRNILEGYQTNEGDKALLGPRAMAAAYNSLPPEEQANVHMFQEATLEGGGPSAPTSWMPIMATAAVVFVIYSKFSGGKKR